MSSSSDTLTSFRTTFDSLAASQYEDTTDSLDLECCIQQNVQEILETIPCKLMRNSDWNGELLKSHDGSLSIGRWTWATRQALLRLEAAFRHSGTIQSNLVDSCCFVYPPTEKFDYIKRLVTR